MSHWLPLTTKFGHSAPFANNSPKTPYLGEILISWLLTLFALPLCALVLYHIRDTNYEVEEVARVEHVHAKDVDTKDVENLRLPEHHKTKEASD